MALKRPPSIISISSSDKTPIDNNTPKGRKRRRVDVNAVAKGDTTHTNDPSNFWITCAKCKLLGDPQLLSILEQKTSKDLHEIALRRLLSGNDPTPFSPRCESCVGLKRATRGGLILRASRIHQQGASPQEKSLLDRSFQLEGRNVVRCTDKGDSDQFAKGIFDRRGNGHWKRETLGLVDTANALEPALQASTVNRVAAQPNYMAIKSWLNHCTENHSCCEPILVDAARHMWLIDVNTWHLVPYPYQNPTTLDRSKALNLCYIALSYVWGDVVQSTVRPGLLPKQIPRTIHDAITVVKRLGRRYLWVDSICIDQGNETGKQLQIQMMNTIYSGAFATIVALDGTTVDSGLPAVGRHSKRVRQTFADFGEWLQKCPVLRASWNMHHGCAVLGLIRRPCCRGDVFFLPNIKFIFVGITPVIRTAIAISTR